MTTITNTFETGLAPGTAITAGNSDDGLAGTAFNFVSVPSTNTGVFSNVNPAHGTLGLRLTITASSNQVAYCEWSTALLAAATDIPVFARIYFMLSALPVGANLTILRGLTAGPTQRWRVSLNTAGNLLFQNGANTTVATSSTTFAAGTRYRIETSVASSATDANCVAEVRIYLGDSLTPIETMGPGGAMTGWVAGGTQDRIRYGQGVAVSLTSTVTYDIDDVGGSDVTWLGQAGAVAAASHVWLGAITDDSAVLAAGLVSILSARIKYSTADDLSVSPAFTSAEAPAANGSVKFDITGLTADTDYWYGLEADGVMLPTVYGPFHALPAEDSVVSHTIAFGSCNMTDSNSITFSAIAAFEGLYGKPLMAVHEGDLHYRDWGSVTVADVDFQYLSSMSKTNVQALVSTVPMPYVWDNHDWGGDQSGADAAAGPAVSSAYRDWVPHYDLDATNNVGAWQTWKIGRIRYILLDTRSAKSPYAATDNASKTMLGAEQKAWFKALLTGPEPLKIIMSPIYWRRDAATSDRWGSYRTEYDELIAYIEANNVNAYVAFGDRHALCADDGSSSTAGGIPQAGGAAWHQGSVPQPGSETWSHGYYAPSPDGATMHGYGVLDVTDTGASITVAYRGITSADGIVRVSMTTEFVAAPPLVATFGIHL